MPTIQWKIRYQTKWGERLCLELVPASDPNRSDVLWMHFDGNAFWKVVTDAFSEEKHLTYRYGIQRHWEGDLIEWEEGPVRCFEPHPSLNTSILDFWRSSWEPLYHMGRSCFTQSIFQFKKTRRILKKRTMDPKPGLICWNYSLLVPPLGEGEVPVLVGNIKELGSWHLEKGVPLTPSTFPEWHSSVMLDPQHERIQYKIAIVGPKGELLRWEERADREVTLPPAEGKTWTIWRLNDHPFETPTGLWRGTGVVMPVNALRSKRGFGIGEFLDLKELVRWCRQSGIRLVQLLPVNDTISQWGPGDSSPYTSISVFALHPLLVNLEALWPGNPDWRKSEYLQEKERLNSGPNIDWQVLPQRKRYWMHRVFQARRGYLSRNKNFQQFCRDHQWWLLPYAAFCTLRDHYGTTDFDLWGEHAQFSEERILAMNEVHSPFYSDMLFWRFLQFHAHQQFSEAAETARKWGVVLKGDLPIGVRRHSVDTWQSPQLFRLDECAGAPPDDFSREGQNWRFPTYDWTVMAQDQFSWWKNRLRHMSLFFDAYRIDHILGFFRLWTIPQRDSQGLRGYFFPAEPVTEGELRARGIHTSLERLLSPYITEWAVRQTFREEFDWAVQQFFQWRTDGRLMFKDHLANQALVESFFQERDPEDPIQYWRGALLGFHNEVLFLCEEMTDAGQIKLHPRHSFWDTQSYRDLDDWTKHQLYQLYLDYFYHRQEHRWRREGLWKLPVLKKATSMLVCGEDLGMVPDCVPKVMAQLGILSLRIQRMPNDSRKRFDLPQEYPYMSVCSTSTHDMPPLRVWWERNRSENQSYFNHVLGMHGQAPYFAEDWLCQAIIRQHLNSPSMWAIFPIQDLLGMQLDLRRDDPFAELINDPSISNHTWQYRLHLSVEQLLEHKHFAQKLQQMILQSGRYA